MLIYFMGHEISMNVRHPHEKPMSPSSKIPFYQHQHIKTLGLTGYRYIMQNTYKSKSKLQIKTMK